MAVDIGTAQGYLDLDISRFTSALTQANAAASTQMKSMSQNFSSGFQAIGNTLTSAGKTMTTAVTAPVAALGAAAVKTTATFDSSMSKVRALSGATGEDFEALSNKAKEMGATTRYSASEAADALGYMALAGWDTNQMVSGLDGVLNLAAASNMDLAQASDMVTDYLSAFGLEAKDAAKMADQMAYAQAHSNTTTIQLGEAFGNSAANMASAGQTMETTTALLEAMANQGTKGSEAGTALAAIMRDITHKMEDGSIAIGDTTVAVQDQNGNFRSLIDIMADVEKATEGMGTAEKSAALSSVFTAHSIRGVNQILMEGTDAVRGYEDALYGAGGTAKEMADQMLNNLNGQLTILKSALEALAIQVGEILMPYVKQFVSWVQQLVEKFSALSTVEKEQIIKFALIAAAIGPALLVLGKFLTGIATMIKTFGTLKTAFSAIKVGFTGLSAAIGGISAPIVAIVAAIGALIAAFATLWKTNEKFRKNMTAIWDGIKAKFEGFANGVVERLNALGFDFENFAEVVGAIWRGFCDLLAPVFEGAFKQLSVILGAVLDALTGVLDVFIGVFTGNWEQAWTGVKEIFNAVWSLLTGTFENWANTFKGVADTVFGWFGVSWNEVWTGVSATFMSTWNSIIAFFTNAANAIESVATPIFTTIGAFFTTIWGAIRTVFVTVVNAISTFLTNAWNNIEKVVVTVFNSIYTFLSTIWKTIFTMISTVVTTIWDTIKTVFTNILLTITEIVLGINNIITSIFNAIKEFLKGNTEQTKEYIRQAWQTTYNLVTAIITNMRNTISTVFNAIKSIIQTVMNAIKTIMTTTWNAIKTMVTNVVNAIKSTISSVFNAIKTTINTIMNEISTLISKTWNAIKTTITSIVEAIKRTVTSTFTSMKSSVTTTVEGLKSTITNVFNGIKTAMSNAIDAARSNVVSAMVSAKNGMINAFSGIEGTFSGIGRNVIQGLINGIESMVGSLYNSIRNALSGLVSRAKSELGISSPSRVFKKEVGRWIPLGIADGFTAAMPTAEKQMQAGLDNMVDNLNAKQVDVGLATNMMSAFETVASYFESIEQRLVDSVNGMKNTLVSLVEAGQAVIDGDGTLSYVGYNGFAKPATVRTQTQATGGTSDTASRTYVFYSNKSIDEIEAAKQIKKTERDIAEGFM